MRLSHSALVSACVSAKLNGEGFVAMVTTRLGL